MASSRGGSDDDADGDDTSDRGLRDDELLAIEVAFGLRFPLDLRALLAANLGVSTAGSNGRRGAAARVARGAATATASAV